MSLALPAQPPRRLGGPALGGPPSATGGNGAPPTTTTAQPEFLLDTLAGVEGGPVAMGAEEEASSVEAVASPPPVPPAPAPTKSSHRSSSHHHHHHHHHGYANCFGLPYQDHNYGAPPPATPPQSPPPAPPPRSPIRGPSPGGVGSARSEGVSPLQQQQPAVGGPPPRLNGTLGSPPPGLGSALLEAASNPPLTNGGLLPPLSESGGHKKGAVPPLDLQGVAGAPGDDGVVPAEESVTRCICGFNQDDEYMICCDRCLVWQHVDCMGLDRSRIPETYLCERCCPRRVDRQRARSLQTRKKHQMARLLSRLESAAAAAAAEESGTMATHAVTDEKAPQQHGRNKGGATDAESCSPSKRGGSRVVRRKRRRSETSPDAPPAPPPLRKIQVPTTNPRKTMKEKIERKKVKLKGMVKRSSSSGGRGGGRVLTTELPPSSAEGEEVAVGDPWRRGGSCNWAGPDGDGATLSYERAHTNQYSPEVQLLASSLQEQHEELLREVLRPGWEGAWRLEECPSSPKGRGGHPGGGRGGRRLVASRPVVAHQPLLEVRGKVLSAGQFRLQNPVFQKRLYPYVLFYKGLSGGSRKGLKEEEEGDREEEEEEEKEGSQEEEWVCVDGRAYGNEARFVRRSCRPSARVLHTLQGGLLRLYLVASRDMAPGTEITIPFDFDYRHCIHRVTCACGQDDCRLNRKGRRATSNTPPERKRRGRRMSSGSGSHGVPALAAPEVKVEVKDEVVAVPPADEQPSPTLPPRSLSSSGLVVPPAAVPADEEEVEEEEEEVTTSGPTSLDNTKDENQPAVCAEATTSSNDHQDGSPSQLASPDSGGGPELPGNGGDDPDGDPPGPAQGARRRKMTREERKIDAIMRAFEKMERTEKRRQQALERMAQQHHHRHAHPDEAPASATTTATTSTVKLEPSEEHSEDGSQVLPPPPLQLAPTPTSAAATTLPEAESSRGGLPEEGDQRSRSATAAAHQQQRAASRKGKRRRSTLSRRRTRSNSGGPELLLAAAATVGGLEGVGCCPEGVAFPPGPPPSSPPPQASHPPPLATSSSYEALLPSPLGGASSPGMGCCSPGQQQQDASSSSQRSYALPKSKRFLMQGWLHEKAEQQQDGGAATPAHTSSSSAGVGGECPVFVRCTRDGGGISAAHLRRHSCSSSTPNAGGSAKKRWLRQAMFESTEEAPDESHLVEGASSELPAEDVMLMSGGAGGEDSCHSVSSPPPGGGADLVTPLKKRRLVRESRGSLDSLAGGLSPATGEAAATLLSFQTPLLLLASQAQQLQMQMQQQQQLAAMAVTSTPPHPPVSPTIPAPTMQGEHVLLVPQPPQHPEYPMADTVPEPLAPAPPLANERGDLVCAVGGGCDNEEGVGGGSPLLDDPPTPLDDEGSVDWEDGPPSSPPEVALGPRLLPPLTSGQPSPLELAGRGLPLEGRPPKATLRLPEPLPGPQPEDDEDDHQGQGQAEEQPPPRAPAPCEEPAATSFQKPLRQEPDSRPSRASDSTSNPVPEAAADPEPRAEWGRPDGPDVSDSSSSSSLVSGAAQAPLSPGAARRASSLQKRKVSLSEYRQRMRETARGGAAASSASAPSHPPSSSSSVATPAASQVPSLAALGLQDTLALPTIKANLLGVPSGGAPPPPPPPPPSSVARGGGADEDESWPQRERLSQRLRREFGLLDDDSDTERGSGHPAATAGPESGGAPVPPLPQQPPLMAAPPPMGLPYPHGYLPVPPMQVSPFGPPLTALRPPLLPAALLGGAPPPPPPHPGLPPAHRPPPGYFHHS